MSLHAVLGLLTCVCYASVQGDFNGQCILKTQKSCQEVNEDLGYAEVNKDNDVCKHLLRLFQCVAEHVPQCYTAITEHHKRFHASPFFCEITVEQIIKLQQIINNRQTRKPEVTYVHTPLSVNSTQAPPALIKGNPFQTSLSVNSSQASLPQNVNKEVNDDEEIKQNSSEEDHKGNCNKNNASHLLLMVLLALALTAS